MRGGKPPEAADQSVPVFDGVGLVLVRAHGEVGERFEVFLRLVLLEARLGVVQPHEVLEKRAAAGDELRDETKLADKVLDVRRAMLEGALDRIGDRCVGRHEPLRFIAPQTTAPLVEGRVIHLQEVLQAGVSCACMKLMMAHVCVSVGRLLEADSDSGVVRKILRMFASEAKQQRNDNRDSSRTYLAMNLGTGNTTYEMGGRPAGARKHSIRNGRVPGGRPQCVEQDVQVVRRNVAEERT